VVYHAVDLSAHLVCLSLPLDVPGKEDDAAGLNQITGASSGRKLLIDSLKKMK